jgi:hypothetical protein
LVVEEDSVAKASGVKDLKDLRYSNLFTVVSLVLVIAWCVVAKVAVDRLLLPVLSPEAAQSAGALRVTNKDGILSNGPKLRGWRYDVYFGVYAGIWMTGCAAFSVALMQVWPSRGTPKESARDTLKKPAPTDDLA